MKSARIRNMTVTAMLCALAYIVMFLIHFKVMFLTFDLKDAILTLTALLYGPVYGVVSAALVALLEFVTVSDTGLYGLLMNFLSSATFALVAGAVYKRRRDLTGAVLGMVFAAVAMIAVMMAANLLITPFYMGVTTAEVGAMIPTLLLPFNACKAVMNAAAVLLIYKPLTVALRRVGVLEHGPSSYKLDVKTVVIAVSAVVLIVATCLVLTVVLGGNIG